MKLIGRIDSAAFRGARKQALAAHARSLAAMTNKAKIAGTANEIYDLLTVLPSPRDAAQALALAHVMLIENAGGDTEQAVRIMMIETTTNVIENWRARRVSQ